VASVNREAAVATPTASAKDPPASLARMPRLRALPFLITLGTVIVAVGLGWASWQTFMATPWTRDGTVRAYVVSIAPEVSGRIVALPAEDNQFVHKGDLLVRIDPANYEIAVRQAEAGVEQAKAVAQNAQAEWTRRQKLNDLAVTLEEQQSYAAKSLSADAQYQLSLANLQNARLNLQRTSIVSPVNGYVTNLLARVGDYANVGERVVSVIDADSYWVDAYFEETFLGKIRDGDAASVKLMGYSPILRGRVQGVARGINVPNAAPAASGLASVNPIFAFVRLAQRVPVRIQLVDVPSDVRLVAGMTATVQIDPGQVAAAGSAPTIAAAPPAPVPAFASSASSPGEKIPSAPGDRALEGSAAAASAAAILPALPPAAGGAGASATTPPPTAGAAGSASPQAPALLAASPTATPAPTMPRATSQDAALDETAEAASDEALDRALNITAPSTLVQPSTRAPDNLRRRGRHTGHRRGY
jgi:RND family efflux transporter MFP subunit